MVSLTALITFLAASAISVTATPMAGSNPISARAASAEIFMCEHGDWNGACTTDSVELNTCKNVPEGWHDRITAIRNVSQDISKCTWYLDDNCAGEGYDNQVDADLADGDGKFSDSINSYSCKAN
ncbi:hypothetical protein FQN50_005067 [Emmonsiellopsis sp. PD_5]|nr:hypothetical protein FQN50_005067 [Emmonsiellopsis sp. PD_5]